MTNFSRLSYGSIEEFIDTYLQTKEKAAQKMSGLGENVQLLIFMEQATARIKSLELLMQQQEKKEYDAWLTVMRNSREKGEINVDIPNEDIVNLFMHTYQGIRSEQFKNIQNNIDALKMIKCDWRSIYTLITK